MSTDKDERTTVDLYVGTGDTAVWNRQHEVIDRLERPEEEDLIDHFAVQVWARKMAVSGPMAGTRFHRSVVRAIYEFQGMAQSVEFDVDLPCEFEDLLGTLVSGEPSFGVPDPTPIREAGAAE